MALAAYALPVSHYASSSRLASGTWVKVAVDTTGVYAITYDRLRQWGFSNPERVGVYGTGAAAAATHDFSEAVPDDLPPVASMHSDNRLIFYAEGCSRVVPQSARSAEFNVNYYDFNSYYYLVEDEAPSMQMPQMPFLGIPENRTPISRSLAVSVVEPEKYNPASGGVHFFDTPIPAGQRRSYVLDLEDYCADQRGYMAFEYIVSLYNGETGGTPSVALDPHWSRYAVNMGTVTQHTGTTEYKNYVGSFDFSAQNPERFLKADFSVPAVYNGSFWCVDRVYAVFTRANKVGSKNWRTLGLNGFYVDDAVAVEDAPADLTVWNITNLQSPEILQTQFGDDGTAYFTINGDYGNGNTAQVLIFSAGSDFPEPRMCGVVANQNLHSAAETPDMVIITTTGLLPAARELAQTHAQQRGLKVSVVTQNDIFNEFSSGSRCPQALRRYIKMLYDRDATGRLKYVLLYGSSVSDNRFIRRAPVDVLVSMQPEDIVVAASNSTNYCGDAYFGYMDDGSNAFNMEIVPAQLSVGRLPVHSLYQARAMNAKIARYVAQPQSVSSAMHHYMLSDDDDSDKDDHFHHSEEAQGIIRQAYPGLIVSTFDCIEHNPKTLSLDGLKNITNHFVDGINTLWYYGHGAHNNITRKTIVKTDRAAGMRNSTYPWGLFFTCYIYDFDECDGSIIEEWVLNPDGGLIGAVASGRSVFLVYNQALSRAMAECFAVAEPGTTTADLLRLARNSMIDKNNPANSISRVRNALCYNFCGDPSLPMLLPSATVQFSCGDGQSVTAGAGESLTVTANVTVDGSVDASFNGGGQLRLYGPVRESTHKAVYGSETHTFIYEDELLAEYPVSITDGSVRTQIILPPSASTGCRLYLYLRDNTTGTIAAGRISTVVTAGSGETPQSDAPQFLTAYIDSQSFESGDVVTEANRLYAEIAASEAGIVTGVAGVANKPSCVVDGQTDISSSVSPSFADDGTLHLNIPLPRLADGAHSVEISVTDFMGRSTSKILDFTIASEPIEAVLVLQGDAATQRQYVDFDLESISDGAVVTRLFITDSAGNSVHTAESPAFPYRWEPDASGVQAVPDGPYCAWVMIRRGNAHGASAKVPFVLVR